MLDGSKTLLNPTQQKAVEHTIGAPLKVIAGAGTGKTMVLTHRFVRILKEHPDIAPHNILALTFTNKAAAEMKERVIRLAKEEGIIPSDALLELIKEKPKHVELVFSGPNAHEEVLARADLITDMVAHSGKEEAVGDSDYLETAPAEVVTGTGDDHQVDVFIIPAEFQSFDQFFPHNKVLSISDLGTVHSDPGDMVLLLVDNPLKLTFIYHRDTTSFQKS